MGFRSTLYFHYHRGGDSVGAIAPIVFYGSPIVTWDLHLQFSRRLHCWEMKWNCTHTLKLLTPPLLFRFFLDVWFWVQRLSHSVLHRWDFWLPVASGGSALDVNITLLVLVVALMSPSLRWFVWSISPLLFGNDSFYLMLLSILVD